MQSAERKYEVLDPHSVFSGLLNIMTVANTDPTKAEKEKNFHHVGPLLLFFTFSTFMIPIVLLFPFLNISPRES